MTKMFGIVREMWRTSDTLFWYVILFLVVCVSALWEIATRKMKFAEAYRLFRWGPDIDYNG